MNPLFLWVGIALSFLFLVLAGRKSVPTLYPEQWVQELSDLSKTLDKEWTSDIEPYRKAFLNVDIPLFIRAISMNDYKIALFKFADLGEKTLGDVLIVHGYMAHSGHLLDLGLFFRQQNLRVYFLDLPGHGLSSGERFSITDFRDYGQAVSVAWNVLTLSPRPGIMVGHSTGSSAIIESLSLLEKNQPAALVFGAPLVELQRRGFRTTLNSLAGKKTIKLPEIFRNPRFMSQGASKNPCFWDFALLGDPLYRWIYAPSWMNAYELWIQSILNRSHGIFSGPVLIVQGQQDTVIDWRKNQDLLPILFSHLELQFLPSVTHTIFNLVPNEMNDIYEIIKRFIERIHKFGKI
ncbi:MAG: alpha/beta hydrolase [Spirochaetales bacterium]|nr:alpha/beta hydrolase [Spirochaetales bacterium]